MGAFVKSRIDTTSPSSKTPCQATLRRAAALLSARSASRRVQLLSDQESRRARRWRRGHHERRGIARKIKRLRNGGQTDSTITRSSV